MTKYKINPSLGLVVPIDIKVFCVGTLDAGRTLDSKLFAGATTNFSAQASVSGGMIGKNINRSFSTSPTPPLETGVHLHWALPDALTKSASADQGNLIFPAVPNRWLVTRIMVEKSVPSITAWVVESDTLLLTPLPGQQAITLPVTPVSATDLNYRYVGCNKPLTGWVEPTLDISNHTLFKTATGCELTAVASGDIAFAAYYPNCRSVFGFVDQLNEAVDQLMYVVTGWYADPANDPIQNGLTLADIQQQYDWTFTDTTATPSFSVYSGIIQGIDWDPAKNYVSDVAAPLSADVAIGNSSVEAISAYFRSKNYPDCALFEKLLMSFQTGELNKLLSPQPDQFTQLSRDLHSAEFHAVDAGSMYTLVNIASGHEQEVADISLPLADALNLLNLYQQQFDLAQTHLDTFRWQLFADWYRIFVAAADSPTQDVAAIIASDRSAEWQDLLNATTTVAQTLAEQLQLVRSQLEPSLHLKLIPAARYWQPNEPVVALMATGPKDLQFPVRYGGDHLYRSDNYLLCRLSNQLLTAVTINSQTPILASQFNSVVLPTPNGLPYSATTIFSDLLQEACLLNIKLVSELTKVDVGILQTALQALLTGNPQTVYQVTGMMPSPVALIGWDQNPWLPLSVAWQADFLFLQDTGQNDTAPNNYAAEFFTANYRIDADNDSAITYVPLSGNPASILVDPNNTNNFKFYYSGQAILSPIAAQNYSQKITHYLQGESDFKASDAFPQLLQQLEKNTVLTCPLSGFNDALLTRQQNIQLNVAATNEDYSDLTNVIAPIVQSINLSGNYYNFPEMNTIAPNADGYFNPIRAGYTQLMLEVVDVFGQKRTVTPPSGPTLYCAEAMTTYINSFPVPSVAYLPPRLAQPARLLFRWIAADSAGLSEMNPYPITSPICGWVLTNHLDGSLFLYNAYGDMLGTLYLNGECSAIEWQSAPGDDSTINVAIDVVMQEQNPQLRELVLTLFHGSVTAFQDFWRSIDRMNDTIDPLNSSASSSMAILVGRPLALVQAYLRLEVQGRPALNQSWGTFSTDGSGNVNYTETNNGFTEVAFPVILGDMKQTGDGLVGYFKQTPAQTDYDFSTFYSAGADPESGTYVMPITQETLLLTATPKDDLPPAYTPPPSNEPPVIDQYAQKVLMLVDPRARVHASMGILPSCYLQLPADQASQALNRLEMSFPIMPVLKASNGIALPLPTVSGYQFSWVEESKVAHGNTLWTVTSDILPVAGKAIWSYSPQQISEGWLCLNRNKTPLR
jgi:hypothetical protein